MESKEIIELFFKRDQTAIEKTAEEYGSYCTRIAMNILGSHEDSEECVNDTFLKAWQLIPPNKPEVLSVFLGKITRNLAINKLRYEKAAKRGGSEGAEVALEELYEVIPDNATVEAVTDRNELAREINLFLKAQPKKARDIFICRYWFCEGIKDIAAQNGLSENNVSVILNRTRKKLKKHLTQKGMI